LLAGCATWHPHGKTVAALKRGGMRRWLTVYENETNGTEEPVSSKDDMLILDPFLEPSTLSKFVRRANKTTTKDCHLEFD
jgi:hypothetical protein